MRNALLAFFLFLTGCSLFQYEQLPVPSAGETYKHDLSVKINGVSYVGVGVVKRASSYKLEVFPEGKIDRIMWRTCNREEVVDKPPSGWFSNKFEFTVTPAAGLEDITSCGLQITVLEEKKRRNGFAFFDFEDARPEVSLPAKVTCNGKLQSLSGVSVCQSASGLVQQIFFSSPVVQSGSSPECDIMRPFQGDETIYRFAMPPGECTYYFVAQTKATNGKRLLHRLTTIGYTDVLPTKL